MPSWSPISAKANAEAPVNIVKIQKMIKAGSTPYTRWVSDSEKHHDSETESDQHVARTVDLRRGVQGYPVAQQVELGPASHDRVLADIATPQQRNSELRRHRHSHSVHDDHEQVQRGARGDQPDAPHAIELPDRPGHDGREGENVRVASSVDPAERGQDD